MAQMSKYVWEQHIGEKFVSRPSDFAVDIASSLGKAIAFIPALIARTSVSLLCAAVGLAHPSA